MHIVTIRLLTQRARNTLLWRHLRLACFTLFCCSPCLLITPGLPNGSCEALSHEMPSAVVPAGPAGKSGTPEALKGGESVSTPGSRGQPADSAVGVPLKEWLVLGPVRTRLPVFSDTTDLARRAERLLDVDYMEMEKLLPSEGTRVSWSPGTELEWTKLETEDSILTLTRFVRPVPQDTSYVLVAHLACYLDSPRWQKLSLVLKTRQRAAVFLDGKRLKDKESATLSDEEPEEAEVEMVLTRGKHLVVVKTLFDSRDAISDWTLVVALRLRPEAVEGAPSGSLDPVHRFSMNDLMKLKSVRDATLSPDGRLAAFVVSEPDLEKDIYVTHLLVLDAVTGGEVYTAKIGNGISQPEWSPDSKTLAFAVSTAPEGAAAGQGEGRDLWLLNVFTNSLEKLLSGEKGLGRIEWSPDGQYVYFTAWEEALQGDKDKRYEKLEHLYERWDYWKNKAHIFVVSLPGRIKVQLTTGEFNVDNYELSPDGRTIAFLRSVPIPERPFFATELWRLDLGTLATETILTERMDIRSFAWSPDQKRLAFIGESSVATPEDVHNRYRQSLYLLDVSSGTYSKLTEGFVPDVGVELIGGDAGRRALWWSGNERLCFLGTDRSRVRLYCMDPRAPARVAETSLPGPVCSEFDVSADRNSVLCVAASSEASPKAYVLDLRRKTARMLYAPWSDVMKHAVPARVIRQDFVNSAGVPIDGWLYCPQDFDSSASYPVIVYYYGGVSPMGEYFNAWAHWLAGQEYFVYVLTPRGATGYGQPFADVHVNDWGDISAKDVIEGVERLLQNWQFLDRSRIGCYGGSYGGFLTMSLMTQTDLFRAGVSWYGISNIASYWGAGWWGYLYSDVASALSYPWNRPDVYADKSPLFHADRLSGALLLMHGLDDTNVPALESDQMFTALKVLGKDVVYVRWEGEDHGIRGKPRNSRDSREMMLEWFDRYLKEQPGAWEERWADSQGD